MAFAPDEMACALLVAIHLVVMTKGELGVFIPCFGGVHEKVADLKMGSFEIDLRVS